MTEVSQESVAELERWVEIAGLPEFPGERAYQHLIDGAVALSISAAQVDKWLAEAGVKFGSDRPGPVYGMETYPWTAHRKVCQLLFDESGRQFDERKRQERAEKAAKSKAKPSKPLETRPLMLEARVAGLLGHAAIHDVEEVATARWAEIKQRLGITEEALKELDDAIETAKAARKASMELFGTPARVTITGCDRASEPDQRVVVPLPALAVIDQAVLTEWLSQQDEEVLDMLEAQFLEDGTIQVVDENVLLYHVEVEVVPGVGYRSA